MNNVIQFPDKETREVMDILKSYARHSPPFNPQATVRKLSTDELKERSKRKLANFTFAYGSPGAPKL